MSSDEIRVGSSEMMTHAQRQAFLKTSPLGKLFGVAHLLPEVEEATNIECAQATNAKVEIILSVSEKTFLQNVLKISHSYFGKFYYALIWPLKGNLAQ
ncbi:protochlorophyllide oxidoreductase [Nostoc sp.]|uniref:protochlorophyllide oxidoreductase n=1 Tax=Nostoc sp. TaxID=1180 RepID=UPI002FFA4D29